MIEFTKMHGAGNDFLVLEEPYQLTPRQITHLADRHTSVGFDQLITLEPSATADIFMRIHNADGSEAAACGNAARCVADLLARRTGRTQLTIETKAGRLAAESLAPGMARVDMGAPGLSWTEIPLAHALDTEHLPLAGDPVACSMGNPHVTYFVAELDAIDPAVLGPPIERHPLFPERANVGFAQILAPDRIRLRVWERGAGLTRACGSGACAALVNAHRRGLTGVAATLVLDGGELHIEWRDTVRMTGPAVTAFHGSVDMRAGRKARGSAPGPR